MTTSKKELIAIIDFGGTFDQLIAARIREQNVYCEVFPHDVTPETLSARKLKGIVLAGGPANVYSANAPVCDSAVLNLGVPVLGICYGAQLVAHLLGGAVRPLQETEFGMPELEIVSDSLLFKGMENGDLCWMSHSDSIRAMPKGFSLIASTKESPIAAMENASKGIYAVQFHPEVAQMTKGKTIIKNFLYNICECSGDWDTESFITLKVAELKEQIGDKKVLLGLSGGVDSTVSAALIHKAVGEQLTCIFVDHGFMRKNEPESVKQLMKSMHNINFIQVDASQRFLDKLQGVTDPEQKRKIIGEEFIRVFEAEAKKLSDIECLAQGTIYPDVIESGVKSQSVIKSHHNTGGLPEHMDFTVLVEPLRDLFKDEVRNVGSALGLPDSLVKRQPFPGPGLAVRVIGELTREKLDILRDADAIFREEVAAFDETIAKQYFAIFTGIRSVGITQEKRTFNYAIALRAIKTEDFMAAESVRLPYELLEKVVARITSEVPQVNRVLLDITPKPPATIEWE